MNFFGSKKHMEEYYNGIAEEDKENTYCLPVEKAFEVAEKTFSIRLNER